jgi:hypothetical protein
MQGGNMSGTKFVPIFPILVVGLLALYLTSNTALPQAKSDEAPSFVLKLLDGGEIKSSELKGKVAVLKFVASY